MKKNFLLLFLMALLPLAGWAADPVDISSYTVVLSTSTSVFDGDEITAPTVTKLTKAGADDITTGFTITGWENEDGTAVVGLPKNAGTYYCTVQSTSNSSFTKGTYTITKKPVTVTVGAVDAIKFGDALPTYTATYSGLIAADLTSGKPKAGIISGEVTYTTQKGGVEYEAGNKTKGAVGDYVVTPIITALSAANYTFTPVNGSLTVNAKNLPANAIQDIAALTYNASDQLTAAQALVKVKDGSVDLVVNEDYTLVIATDKDAASNGIIKTAQSYWVTIVGKGNYATTSRAYKQLVVNKKDLAISTKSGLHSTYGTAIDLSNLATYVKFQGLETADKNGEVPADDAYATGATLTVELWKDGAKVADPKSTAATYDVVAVGNKAENAMFKNYTPIYFNGGTYEVKKKELVFTIKNQTKKTGVANPLDNAEGVTPTAANQADYFESVEAVLASDNITVYPTLTVSAGKIVANLDNVKVMTTDATPVDVTANYAISANEDATYTTTKGQINVMPVDVTIAYGDAAKTLDVTLHNVADADKAAAKAAILKAVKVNTTGKKINDAGAEVAGDATYPNAGIYTIEFGTIDLGDLAESYDVKTFTGTYTITKRELKSINAKPQTVAKNATALADPSDETIEFVKKDGDTYTITDTDKRLLYKELKAVGYVDISSVTSSTGTKPNKVELNDLTNALSNFKALATGKAALIVVEETAAAITLDRTATDAAKKPWKVIDDNKGKITDVKFGARVLKAQTWNSLVLPFEISVADLSQALGYAIVNLFNESASTASDVKFKLHMGIIPANTPFLVKTNKEIDMADVTIYDVLIEKAAASSVTEGSGDVKFIGIYETSVMKSNNTFCVNGTWIKGNDATADAQQVKLAPLAAYVETPAGAAAPTIYLEDIDGTVTAISAIKADGTAVPAEGWYTLQGVKLQGAPTQKGVYIKDGKKFVIK